MGLDMYLTAERYMWRGEDKPLTSEIRKLLGTDEKMDVKTVELEAAYWRKANAIHRWFVDNVQDGEDECNEHDVSREQLTALRDLCQSVLDNRERAGELLPTQSGFFFGGTEYDDGYFQDLTDTIEQINRALALPECWDFKYQSSW